MDIVNNKKLIKGIIAIILYFGLSAFSSLPFQLFNIDLSTVDQNIIIIYSMAFDVLVLSLMLIIFYDDLKKDFIDVLNNHKEYYSTSMKYWLIGLAVMILSNFIIIFIFKNGLGGNETTVREIFKTHTLYMYLSAIIFGPVVEELIFRQSVRNICGKNWLFIIISSLMFAGVHVIGNIKTSIDLLTFIPYSALGVSFSYMLYKFDNIFVSMGFHFMHNGLLMAFQFLILFFT